MSVGCRELVATDKPTVFSEPFLDTIMVKNSQSDGCFSNTPCTNKSDWSELFCEIDDLLDQFITPETGSRLRRRQFSERDTTKK